MYAAGSEGWSRMAQTTPLARTGATVEVSCALAALSAGVSGWGNVSMIASARRGRCFNEFLSVCRLCPLGR
jgi:hypothetical protein